MLLMGVGVKTLRCFKVLERGTGADGVLYFACLGLGSLSVMCICGTCHEQHNC